MILKQKRLTISKNMKANSKNKSKKETFKEIILILLFSVLLLFLIESTKWLPGISFRIFIHLKNCFVEGSETCFFIVNALSIILTILTEFAFIIVPGVVLTGLLIKEKIKKKKLSKIDSSLKIAACIAFVAQVLIERISFL